MNSNKRTSKFTIGTPLPRGNDIGEQLHEWIGLDEEMKKNPMPVGHLNLVPIPDILKYAFIDQGLYDSSHSKLLKVL